MAPEIEPGLTEAKAARSRGADVLAQKLAETKEKQDAADAAKRAAAEAAHPNSLRSMLQILETQRRLEEARAREDVLWAERDQRMAAADATPV